VGTVRRLSFTALMALSVSLGGFADAGLAADAAPMTEAAYGEAAARWHAIWKERPSLVRREEDACIAAWQDGDRVRTLMRAATPPPRFAAYHAALLDYVEAALAVSDECLLKPRGGPKWRPYLATAREKSGEVTRAVKSGQLSLPDNWW
jgi:hypothetical protein